MFELIKSSFLNLYKINNYLLFLLLAYLLCHDTMNELITFGLENISLPKFSFKLFIYLYILSAVVFFIIELMKNFVPIDSTTYQITWNINELVQYIYLFSCLYLKRIIIPPLENGLIFLVYCIALYAFIQNIVVFICRGITKVWQKDDRWSIIVAFVMMAALLILKTTWITEGITKFQLEWLIELCQKL